MAAITFQGECFVPRDVTRSVLIEMARDLSGHAAEQAGKPLAALKQSTASQRHDVLKRIERRLVT